MRKDGPYWRRLTSGSRGLQVGKEMRTKENVSNIPSRDAPALLPNLRPCKESLAITHSLARRPFDDGGFKF